MSKKYYQSPISKRFHEEGISMSGWAKKNGFPIYIVARVAIGALKGAKGVSKKVIEKAIEDGIITDDKVA
jgi:gp16 family phage-associated protein